MKSETLSMKSIVSELDFLNKQLLFSETLEKKACCCLQTN